MRVFYVLLAAASLATSFCTSKPSGITGPGNRAVHLLPYHVTAEPAVFETSFFPNAQVQEDSVTIDLMPNFLGNLPVPSGRIIATDPVAMRTTAFTTEFPHGRFPVELAVARFRGAERVAFARIVFSAKPVARWELALIPGQTPLLLHDSTYYGYSVDAGTALFIDADFMTGLGNQLNNQSTYEQLFIKSFEPSSPGKFYPTGFLYAAQSDTLAAFTTGWGDGSYATYVGFDYQNHPCRLLTDFQVISWK
ncbi:DUF4241 domain-containing protein [Hymenobacter chitinivorans]|uniref:Uncharacterized protein DUF4241 n=1 Tax=Hymenobacter chitinivorans DSM 11115 TaxID=1121954 RepID=A0A2M9BRF5_9BACT|nr:DUF4241 domain-containing protein [Hymenobacter chitinivorans]PJJ60536.1 uncharacterized protein DUF4241 [Hymenobacter chitinivorans DSM 11115]